MAIVEHYVCDGCQAIVERPEELCVLNTYKALVRGKEVLVLGDKHFCCPACLITYIHNINNPTNGTNL